MDIRNILVPVDFSSSSQLAVDFAVQYTRAFGARLTLLHVVNSDKHDRDALIDRLSKLRSSNGDDFDVQYRIRTGSIEEEILAAIDDELVSMVVLGSHHHGLLRKLLVGSMTQDMLRKVPVPLLTVTSDAYPKSVTRILFATDFTESSREGFRFALNLARRFGANLIVHHSIEPIPVSFGGSMPVIDDPTDRKLLMEHARRNLSELELEGARQQVVVVSEVTEGIASEGILTASEQSGSELIVLTIHHKGLLERALLGSTAERVVREAHVPVLSFPVNDEPMRIGIKERPRASTIPDSSALP